LAFWYCVEWLSLPSRSMSKPRHAARVPCAPDRLAPDEVLQVGVVDVEDHHLGARRVLPPDLMVPAEASAPRMKADGAATPCPRPFKSSWDEAGSWRG